MRRTFLLFAAAATLSTAAVAQPDYTRRPAFGTINLSSGFSDDPRIIDVTAGGQLNAATLGEGCVGSVANAPDVRLNYEAGDTLPLIVSVSSADDTTLVINGPDGRWYCDDDGGENGLNPAVRFDSPQTGQYDIYIGHYQQGRRVPARLFISELTSE